MRNDERHRRELIELCDLNFAAVPLFVRELRRRTGGAATILSEVT